MNEKTWQTLKKECAQALEHLDYEECPAGWEVAVGTAIRKIEQVARQHPAAHIYVEQIKEKYGGVRIYYAASNWEMVAAATDDEMKAIISLAEQECHHTCQQCGSPGEQMTIRRWAYTLCGPCSERLRKVEGNAEKEKRA